MTIPRQSAIRIVASSLCFDQDPPPIRTLDKARTAAVAIVDALTTAGLDIEPGNDNGGHHEVTAVADQDALPLD